MGLAVGIGVGAAEENSGNEFIPFLKAQSAITSVSSIDDVKNDGRKEGCIDDWRNGLEDGWADGCDDG